MSVAEVSDRLAMLQSVARRQLGPAVAVASSNTRDPSLDLMPEEKSAIRGAVTSRRREFAAGRHAARRALAEIGIFGRAIPAAPDRAPVWPEGVSGSISHSGPVCLASVAPAERIRSLGIDIEKEEPLAIELFGSILTDDELSFVELYDWPEAGRLAKVIFSAKECAYKAQYPLSHRLLGFDAIRIELDPGAGLFDAIFTRDVAPFAEGQRLQGQFAAIAGYVLTTLALRA